MAHSFIRLEKRKIDTPFTFEKWIKSTSNSRRSCIILCRSINSDRLTLDNCLIKKKFGEPKILIADAASSITSSFRKLQCHHLYMNTEYITVGIYKKTEKKEPFSAFHSVLNDKNMIDSYFIQL